MQDAATFVASIFMRGIAWTYVPTTLRAAGFGNGVYRSTDAGKSWKKLDGEVSRANQSFVEAFAFDPANFDHMYAAQQNGDLFGSEDSGGSWFKLNVKAPHVSDMKAAHA